MRTEYTVTLSACGRNNYRRLYTSGVLTLGEARTKYDRILAGYENYGQHLYDPRYTGVFLSMWRDGIKIRTMQIN